jgi:WD40 repeat protein
LIWLGSTVHIWQISEASGVVSAERVLELRGARGPAQWSDDETRILTEGEIWDATTTGTLEEPLITLASNVAVCGCMWNRDNTRVIGHACPYTKDATVFVWDAATGEALLQLPHDESGYWHIYGAIWNRDETRIVSFAQDGSIQFWNAKTGDGTGNRRYNPESTGSLTSLQWSTDSTRVLMAGFTNGLQVWDAATGAPLLHIVSEELTAFSDAFWILDDRYIAAAHVPSDAVFVFDAATGDPVLHMDHPDTIHSLYWNREHTQVMVLSRDRVAVWALTGLSAP